jgi:hypothetical protein
MVEEEEEEIAKAGARGRDAGRSVSSQTSSCEGIND